MNLGSSVPKSGGSLTSQNVADDLLSRLGGRRSCEDNEFVALFPPVFGASGVVTFVGDTAERKGESGVLEE